MPQLANYPDHKTSGDATIDPAYGRYFCDNAEIVRVLVVRTSGDTAAAEARLVDISQTGTKLLLDAEIPRDEQVTLDFQATEFDLPVSAEIGRASCRERG